MNTPHSIEPELQKPAPRPVRRRNSGVVAKLPGCLGCVLIPHTLVGIGLAAWFLWSLILAVAGTSVPAQITGRYTDKDSDGDTTYHLWYSYSQGGQSFEKKASVNSSVYYTYVEGTPVTVKLFPLAPHLAPRLNVPGNRTSGHPLLLLVVAVFWNGIVGVFWWNIFGRPVQQKRLIRSGVPVVGRVLFKRVVTGSYGDSHYVRYEYFPHGQGEYGPLPAVFATPVEAAPLAVEPAPASAPASPFSTTTADSPGSTSAPGAVTSISASGPPKPGWREVVEKAKQQTAADNERLKAAPTPGALARQEPVDAKDFASVQPGDWLTVLHDPRKPKSAIAYRFSAYEAV